MPAEDDEAEYGEWFGEEREGAARMNLTHIHWRLEAIDPRHVRVSVAGQPAVRVVQWLGEVVPLRPYSGRGVRVETFAAIEHLSEIERFLAFAAKSIPVSRLLTEGWACRAHFDETGRSAWGTLLRRAKPYDGDGDIRAARELGRRMADHLADHPAIGPTTAVVPVPSYRPRGAYSLPHVLAETVAERLGACFVPDAVRKTRATPEMKYLAVDARPSALSGAFAGVSGISPNPLLIDDVVQTGATLAAVSQALRTSGATAVRSVAATWAKNGMRQSQL